MKYPNKKILFFNVDVAIKENVDSTFSEIVRQFTVIDIVISTVGIVNEKNYEQCIGVNLV